MKKFDAIIILPHEMDRFGVLGFESQLRANLALRLWQQHSTEYLITSGWNYRTDSKVYLADAFTAYLKNAMKTLSFRSNPKILVDINSRDTVGDAFFTKTNLIEKKGLQRLCVVTSDYHVARADLIFKFIFGTEYDITVIGCNTGRSQEKSLREELSIVAFKTTFKNAEAGNNNSLFNAIIENHPYYNGFRYSKYIK